MIDLQQLRTNVVRPVLQHLVLWSPAAEVLVLATAAHESLGGRYLRQDPAGPALGIYQMEPATHDDIWTNFLQYKRGLAQQVNALRAPRPSVHEQLMTNLAYATAMCRVHYYRQPAPLPEADDVAGLAAYWKRYYNTPLGKGVEADFVAHWRRANGMMEA